MLTVLSANGPSGYSIANSLRFRASASAYLNRTPSVAGNQKTWTWSVWVKRGVFGQQQLFSADRSAGSEGAGIQFTASNQIQCYAWNGSSYDYNLISSQVFRDPSAWYHIDLLFDTTQATSSNRIKIYVNGVQITAFDTSTYPAQNLSGYINSAQLHTLGRASYYSGLYFDGYLTEVNFIDGQALTPSSFGETSSTTGVWIPKKYTGSYGTNGFYLNFNNGTSTTTLGYDSSGNGNNWTTNNISLTAGSTYDWMIDSPTKYPGSSYGVGNYAVMNALSPFSQVTMSQGNLAVTFTDNRPSASTFPIPSTGKWYFEGSSDTIGYYNDTAQTSIGLIPQSYTTQDANLIGLTYCANGIKNNAGTSSSYGASYVANDIIGVAVNMDAGTVTFYKNNTSQGTAFSGISTSTIWFASVCQRISGTWTMNFGQRPFAYTPPSGYKSLCTQNLPGVTIQNGAQYMAATTYTGSGSTQTLSNAVNGVSFQPDLVWIKVRNSTQNHCLFDSIRGVGIALNSNATAAEYNSAPSLTAFSSNGFNLGADTNTAEVNVSTKTYVGWQWKAGGTAVTNTAGSITSSVSANTTSGFSVVTYTGNGIAGATVGHGLGVAPKMVITKTRGTASDWGVYHESVGPTAFLRLNTTAASQVASTVWNNTAPSSTVITLGTASAVNDANGMVAYCFAAIPGYSAFGSYTGNGSSDGPFVYCGFRPRYVLIKCSSTGGTYYDWAIFDTSRAVYNVIGPGLYADSSGAEFSGTYIDILSNGFKTRDSSTTWNQSSQTYIYACFAENPFKYSLAR